MVGNLSFLSENSLEKIHHSSVKILQEVGVAFRSKKALKILKKNGAQVDEDTKIAYFPEELVNSALKKCPQEFSVKARSSANDITIGGVNRVYAPAYGAPFISELNGKRRKGTLKDFINLIKLVQISEEMNCNGGILVEPQDLPSFTRHLDMIYNLIIYSDKPFMGNIEGRAAAEDSLVMVSILAGGEEELKRTPMLLALINTQSPLTYDGQTLEAMTEYISWGQPIIIAPLISAGISGPVTLSGTVAQHNAEVLAGIIFAQMVNQGAPVVYGSASCSTDMRTAKIAIGSPESALLTSIFAQIARWYHLPSRAGGTLTDSKVPDIQSGYEKMMVLMSALLSGVNFILHSAGILDSYLTISYEQFVIDLEMIRSLKRFIQGIDISEEKIALKEIKEVGAGGSFLDNFHTSKYFREEFFLPTISDRSPYETWELEGSKTMYQRANTKFKQMLETYQHPELDPKIKEKLENFVSKRKKRSNFRNLNWNMEK